MQSNKTCKTCVFLDVREGILFCKVTERITCLTASCNRWFPLGNRIYKPQDQEDDGEV